MLNYPQFDPVMISLGPLQLRWYGMMYVFGILSGWLLGRYRATKPWNKMTPKLMDDFITWAILGVVLGGRIGYVLFYNPSFYLANPLKIFAVWEGGMSFHGGCLGVLAACWLFGRAHDMTFPEVGDFVSPLVPPGLFLRAHRQLHQRRAVGPVHGPALGHAVPGRRRPAAPSLAALRGRARGAAPVHHRLVLFGQTQAQGGAWARSSCSATACSASWWSSPASRIASLASWPCTGCPWARCFACP